MGAVRAKEKQVSHLSTEEMDVCQEEHSPGREEVCLEEGRFPASRDRMQPGP